MSAGPVFDRENGRQMILAAQASRQALEANLTLAISTIDRIDTALRGDGRSAMLVVTAQEIINDYRDKADG